MATKRRAAIRTSSARRGAPDPEEILEQIEERGFAVVPSLIPRARIDRMRAILDELRARERIDEHAARRHQRVLHLAAKHPAFLEPLVHPLVLGVFRRWLGEDMICSTWSSNTIFPGATEIYWHVDHPYWTIAPPYPLAYPLTGQAIWLLDDFTEDNGATAFLPGSHRIPRVPELDGAWPDEAEIAVGPRGSVVLAHGACWHTTTPNPARRPRSALLARYGRTFMVPQEDMRMQLAAIEQPSDTVRQLLGENQYQPQRGFPY